MSQQGWFDATGVPQGWFAENGQAGGWFATELLTSSSSAPVGQPQDADWDWSEQLSTDSIPSGYQNSDATPVLTQAFGDEWDWNESVDDEWQAENQLQAVIIAAQPAGEDWDWSETVDDEWATDQTLQSVVVATPQPVNDEWDWSEFVASDTVGGGYQQADNAPVVTPTQNPDADWDWDEQVTDEWTTDQTVSVAVVASPIQHTHSEWDWDEVLFSDLVVSGYQQADNAAAPSVGQPADLEWDFESGSIDEDGWSNHFTNYDPLSDQAYELDWDWAESIDDDWAVDQVTGANAAVVPDAAQQAVEEFSEDVNDDWWTEQVTIANVAVVTDPIQHTSAEWDWDEVLFSDVVTSGYQQADNAVVANSDQQPQTDWDFDSDFGGEGGWSNHYTAYDPETQVFDDPWDWDESCDFEWQDESGPVVANNAPVVSPIQHTSAEWDWDEYAEETSHELIDYSPVVEDYVPPIPEPGDDHDGWWLDHWRKKHKKKRIEQIETIEQAQAVVAEIVAKTPKKFVPTTVIWPSNIAEQIAIAERILVYLAKIKQIEAEKAYLAEQDAIEQYNIEILLLLS